MISWTISAAAFTTASQNSIFTNSNSFTGIDTDGGFSFSNTSYYSAHTSSGLTGTTLFLRSSSSSAAGTDTDSDGNGTGAQTFLSAPTYQAATSTTRTIIALSGITTSYVDEESNFEPDTFLTTTKTATDATVEFVEETEPHTIYDTAEVETTITRTTTTTLGDTVRAAATGTVWQADFNQILYKIESPETVWGGYEIATDHAVSATRFTVLPSWSVSAVTVVPASATGTTTLANAIVSEELSWEPTATTELQTTTASGNQLPQITGTRTTRETTTTNSSSPYTIFSANTITYGSLGAATSSRTLSVVRSYAPSRITALRQYGTLTYETTATTTASTERTITVFAAASSETTGQATGLARSGNTFNYEGNQTVFGDPQVSVQGVPTPGLQVTADRTIFVTAGAVVDTDSGGWFTADNTISNLFFVTHRRAGSVVFPVTNESYTIGKTAATFTKTQAGSNSITTDSLTYGVEGQTYTRTTRATIGRPPKFGGSVMDEGCTIVEIFTPGAYKNLIGSGSTSFGPDAQIVSFGQDAAAAAWYGVFNISPPSLRARRDDIVFAVARNPNILPPFKTRNDIY